MPETVVHLGDLQDALKKYKNALDKHNGNRIKADGSKGEDVDPTFIDDAVTMMGNLEKQLAKICQQFVLAIHVTPRP